jgi:outer membrane protein
MPFVLALLPGASFAMDLVEAYRAAIAIDPLVASANSQLAATRERVPQAKSGLLPAINATAAVSRQRVDPNIGVNRTFTPQSYGVNLSYPLLRLQNVETFEQSKLAVAAGETQLELARQDLIVRVTLAYFDVLAAQDNLETIQAQKRAITEQLASAKRNFEVGTATITDQQEAQSRFDLSEAQEAVATFELNTKRAALAQLIGKPAPELSVLRPGILLSVPGPARESEWTERARADNLLVQQARVATEIATREIDKQRYGHYPTLDLVGSVGYAESSTAQLFNINYNQAAIGVQFNLPLYAGGGIDAKVREAAALKDKSFSDLENARRQAEQTARQSFLAVNGGLAQVRALEAAEKSSKLALDSNLLGYQVGVRINIDVLNAQQQLYTTQRDLSKARYDVILNGMRLKLTTGGLSEEDLERVSKLLEPPTAAAPVTAPATK